MFEFDSYTNGLLVHPIAAGRYRRPFMTRVQIDVDSDTGTRRLTPVSGYTLERVPGHVVIVDSYRWEHLEEAFFTSDIEKSYTLLEVCGYSRNREGTEPR